MLTASTLLLCYRAILTTASIIFAAADVSAASQQDLEICQDSADVPIMIKARTNLAQDARLPPGARSMALLKRGFGNFALGNIDAAEVDFSDAIRLNPKNQYAHHELGLTLVRKGEMNRAIASFGEAIKIDPSSAASRFSRGRAYTSEGNLDEAIEDFTAAIKLGADKNTAFAKDQVVDRPEAKRIAADYYGARADAYYLRGSFKDAVSDYDRAAGLSDPTGYMRIWGSVARTQGGSGDADSALSAALGKGDLKDWSKSVGELLIGRITPAAALAAAKDAGQICEAHYYSGIAQLKAKDLVLAQNEFATARDGCPSAFREHAAAVADLKRLQAK